MVMGTADSTIAMGISRARKGIFTRVRALPWKLPAGRSRPKDACFAAQLRRDVAALAFGANKPIVDGGLHTAGPKLRQSGLTGMRSPGVRRVFTFSCGMLPRFHYAEGLCQPQVLKASDTTKTRRAQVIDAQTTRLQVLVRTSNGGVVDRTGADLRGQLPSFERSQIAAAQDPARYSPTNCQRSLCRSKGSRLSAALQVDWERGGVGVDRAPGT